MGYWKYWSDYSGIGGLLERGYDVLGISAMYNHSFYLADLSPTSRPRPGLPWSRPETQHRRDAVPGGCGASGRGER